MSNVTTPPAQAASPAVVPATPRTHKSGAWHAVRKVLLPLASIRLTVVLFVLSLLLVFIGTLAQKDFGIWSVVRDYFRSAYVFVPFKIFFPQVLHKYVGGGFPFPGGWLIGGALLVNLLAAHVVRFKLSWRRSGVLVLHAGLIVMMVGELITGLYAIEGNMTIDVGGSSNFLVHQAGTELAVIDPSDAKLEDVVVVPGRMLKAGGRVQNDQVPFDIEVHQWMVNSGLGLARGLEEKDIEPGLLTGLKEDHAWVGKLSDGDNPATAGLGRNLVALPRREVSGADPDQKVDVPSAYVTLRNKQTGEPIGTYLMSVWLSTPQQVTVGGKTYDVALRFKRTYKAYTVHLHKFIHELYPDTSTPKHFSSDITITDPTTNESRDATIWMNHPMRFHGETFYQAGFLPGNSGTVLQVVRNPGWMLPYISCALVAGGMLFHFGLVLYSFLRKKRAAAEPTAVLEGFARFVPWIAMGIGVLWLVVAMMPPANPANGMHIQDFAATPVWHAGRIRPIDTVARAALMNISERKVFRDNDGNAHPAVQWLLDVMTFQSHPQKGEKFYKERFLRITGEQVLGFLHLEPRPGFRYSLAEVAPKVQDLAREATRARKVDEAHRDLFDGQVIELAEKLQTILQFAAQSDLKVVPPKNGSNDWLTIAEAQEQHDPAGFAFETMLGAYAQGDARSFNKALDTYQKEVDGRVPEAASKAGFETFFNNFNPFFHCGWLYVMVLLLGCLSWLAWGRPLARAAYFLAILTYTVHTWALIARMYMHGMPPVTNLYASAIFIGWVACGLCLAMEPIFKKGFGTVVAGFAGAATMYIADSLATGDTMEAVRAVLNTPFWLSTHVTTVTFGYAATYVAGLLGMAFVICGELSRRDAHFDKSVFKTLSTMIYGVVCFATLFSFVGTVLGGIWADQSWGRFWGWDPKENGALLIVIWNALILHARWSGMVRERGIAVLAILGNVITSWSWFGTNMLGVGLHSYGFMAGAAVALVSVIFVFLGFMAWGMWLPRSAWR